MVNKRTCPVFLAGGLLYDGIDSWEPDWQDYWLDSGSLHRDTKYTLPSDFPLDAFTELASWGYQIACFPCRQNTGDPNAAGRLDMAAIYADKLGNGSIQPGFVDRWQAAFEDAAAFFQITDPDPWNPHPNACPTTPCPPCEEP